MVMNSYPIELSNRRHYFRANGSHALNITICKSINQMLVQFWQQGNVLFEVREMGSCCWQS